MQINATHFRIPEFTWQISCFSPSEQQQPVPEQDGHQRLQGGAQGLQGQEGGGPGSKGERKKMHKIYFFPEKKNKKSGGKSRSNCVKFEAIRLHV